MIVTVEYYQHLIPAVLRAELGTGQPMRAIAATECILLEGKVRVPWLLVSLGSNLTRLQGSAFSFTFASSPVLDARQGTMPLATSLRVLTHAPSVIDIINTTA